VVLADFPWSPGRWWPRQGEHIRVVAVCAAGRRGAGPRRPRRAS